ncbi:MAG: Hsp20 family protein [Rhodospirillales bacterium]|nr:Hsp20 family protein [Rhodospirillales bacterium]MDH3913923.1 Hsp20 family protein [Rhodospirillales bacterium]MDH3920213.1 Hsp20 family protein [Rhodospirillales bacterium]MDH3969102.1 Hsp20 family protein [Rhodospirillales bacterium]
MRTYDLSPLMRATVGFDRLTSLLDTASRVDEATLGYPPYNIEKTGEETYRITMAVAGFGEADLDVTVQENSLVIKAGKAKPEADKGVRYLHRGIATRAFERRFDLADHIQVTGARLENGILSIELEREVPEAMKPRSIAIETKGKAKVIENAAA